MIDFSTYTLYDISKLLKEKIQTLKAYEYIEFKVLNPDLFVNKYNGYEFVLDDKTYIYRSYKTWFELAEQNICKMQTPRIIDDNFVILKYIKLNENISFHKDKIDEEKYGIKSEFFNINKNEDISYLQYYVQALENVNINKKFRILNLGINKGDEFDIIKKMCKNYKNIEFVGIDYSSSIIKYAKDKFSEDNFTFLQANINHLDEFNLGKFDLIISVGTLQSSSINFKLTFNNLVQNYLQDNASIVLGFPNCKYIDGAMIYGSKMKNYSFTEMSLIIKDIHYCKKYLQQKKYKVIISGKDYIFLSANKI